MVRVFDEPAFVRIYKDHPRLMPPRRTGASGCIVLNVNRDAETKFQLVIRAKKILKSKKESSEWRRPRQVLDARKRVDDQCWRTNIATASSTINKCEGREMISNAMMSVVPPAGGRHTYVIFGTQGGVPVLIKGLPGNFTDRRFDVHKWG